MYKRTMRRKNGSMVLIYLVSMVMVAFMTGTMYGCGSSSSSSSSGGTSSTNYTVSGVISAVDGARAMAVSDVTDIVAVSATNNKYRATPEAGVFSIDISSGTPYVLGFYSKSGSTITLLGYLRQSEVDWDSLPVINPTGEATDLGSVEVDSTSVEATPSIDVTSLIDQMNMDVDTANAYGEIDDTLAVLTNLDVDGSGEFDFVDNKHYMFHTYIGMGISGETPTGQIDEMLSGYNDSYMPEPINYQLVLAAQGDDKDAGTVGTLSTPVPVGGQAQGDYTQTQSATIQAFSDGGGWSIFWPSLGSPEVAPSGTYVATIDSTTYTIENFQASNVVSIESNNGFIYPIFNLVTNEANIITTVNFQWKKLENGTVTDPTDAELQAIVEETSDDTVFVHTSPFISFFEDSSSLIGGCLSFDRDGSSLDVSSYNIALADIHHIQASYNLTSRVVIKFDLY